jgi:hypothetical protein
MDDILGKKIRIKTREQMISEFGVSHDGYIPVDCTFIKPMTIFCGKKGVVTKARKELSSHIIRIRFSGNADDAHLNREAKKYNFSEDMINILNEGVKLPQKSFDDFEESIL